MRSVTSCVGASRGGGLLGGQGFRRLGGRGLFGLGGGLRLGGPGLPGQPRGPLAHEGDHVVEGRVVAQLQAFVEGDLVGLADRREHLGLLDRVDPQVGLEVEVEVEQVGRVAGLLGDQGEDAVGEPCAGGDLLLGRGLGRRLGGRRRLWRRDLLRRGLRRLGRCRRYGLLGRRRRGRAAVDDPQPPLHHLQLGGLVAADRLQPGGPPVGLRDPVGVAQLLRVAAPAVAHRDPAQQHQADLRAEPGREPKRVVDRVGAALGEVEGAEFRIDVAEVRHRWNEARLERLDRHDVLDANAHRMAGEPLGVGDQHPLRGVAEDPAQRVDLGRRAAPSGRRVGLVGDEHHLLADPVAVQAGRLGSGDHVLHHVADVVDVEAGAVEGAVGDGRAEHLADRRDPAFARRVGALDDQRRGAHPEQHSVATLIEGQGGLLDDLVSRGCAGGQEPGADPRQQLVRGRVVGRDDDRPPAASHADPVLGDRDGLGRACAGRVDLRVRPARADQLGELGVTHREDAEEEAAVEPIRFLFELDPQVVDLAVDLGQRDAVAMARESLAQGLDLGQPLPARAILREALRLRGELLDARERRCEDHAGVVAQHGRAAPSRRAAASRDGRLVVEDEGDAGVAKGVDAGADRELGAAPQSRDPVGVDAELGGQVQLAPLRGELDHVVDVVDRLEARRPVVALDQAHDVTIEDLVAQARGDEVDELLAVEDSRRLRRRTRARSPAGRAPPR